MTFNPDNLIFFYLILALLAVAFAIVYYADHKSRQDKPTKHRK